jgi:hypothetical protein
MSALRVVLALIAASAVLAAPYRDARATTVEAVTVEELSRRADAVLVVVVRSSQSQWIGGRIDTDYDLEVQSVLRGSGAAHSHVVLRMPGGAVGGIAQAVPGVPSLAIGQSYVVFVSRDRRDASLYYLTHLTASVLAVSTAPDGTATVAPAPMGMITNGPTTAMQPRGLPIDALVAAVRSAR